MRLDPDRQEEARRYSAESRRLMLVDLALSVITLVLFLWSGASGRLAAWAGTIAGNNPWLTIALYGAVLFVAYLFLSLPLSYVSGYQLPHRYGMSRQSLGDWAKDSAKGLALTALLGGAIIEAIYALLRWQPEWWWLWAGLFLLGVTVVLGQMAPVLILPLFFKLTPIEDERLRERLEKLGERAGAKVEGVFTINLSSKSAAANAVMMGLGKTRRIALGDTLYRDFTHEEIELIFAHELGHYVHGDLPRMILLQSLLTLGGLWLADLMLGWGVEWFGFESRADIGAFPLFVLAMGLFSILTMPLLNGFSRSRERMADRYALETTGDPESMVRVMTRLANQNLADVAPPKWVTFLLHSHPPLQERIAAAAQFRADHPRALEKGTS